MTTVGTVQGSGGSRPLEGGPTKVVIGSRTIDPAQQSLYDDYAWTIDRDWRYDASWAPHFPLDWTVDVAEGLRTTDAFAKVVGAAVKEDFLLQDRWSMVATKILNIDLAVHDAVGTSQYFNRSHAESFGLRDVSVKSPGKRCLHEGLRLADGLVKQVAGEHREHVAVHDALGTSQYFNRSHVESVGVRDAVVNKPEKCFLHEGIRLVDGVEKGVSCELWERVDVKDVVNRVFLSGRVFAEHVGFKAEKGLVVDKKLNNERFAFSEGITEETSKNILEAMPVGEVSVERDFTRDVVESLTIEDSYKRLFSKNFTREGFQVNERLIYGREIHFDERFRFKERHSDDVGYSREFSEALAFADTLKRIVDKKVSETLTTYDSLLRPANGVISDLIFEEGDWTEEEVNRYLFKGKHAGYTFFRPFVFGEYRYEKALFRTSLDATDSDGLYIENFNYTVDVPDIVDRGSVEVTDPNYDTVVKFNKKFHVAPEVTVTMRAGVGGQTTIPNIVSISKTEFSLNLRKAVDDSRTTGRFIWTAVGY